MMGRSSTWSQSKPTAGDDEDVEVALGGVLAGPAAEVHVQRAILPEVHLPLVGQGAAVRRPGRVLLEGVLGHRDAHLAAAPDIRQHQFLAPESFGIEGQAVAFGRPGRVPVVVRVEGEAAEVGAVGVDDVDLVVAVVVTRGEGDLFAVGRPGRLPSRHQLALVAAVRIHEPDPHVAVAMAEKGDGAAVGGPGRLFVSLGVLGQAPLGASVGRHHVDVDVGCHVAAGESDLPAVRGPCGILLELGSVGDAGGFAAGGGDGVEIPGPHRYRRGGVEDGAPRLIAAVVTARDGDRQPVAANARDGRRFHLHGIAHHLLVGHDPDGVCPFPDIPKGNGSGVDEAVEPGLDLIRIQPDLVPVASLDPYDHLVDAA